MDYDVIIIGAGPSGTAAASILNKSGLSVGVFERELFPRFSIGESLLPKCTELLEKSGLLKEVNDYGFQHKNGAAFLKNGTFEVFDFIEKSSEGPATTVQVKRAEFDKLLADTVESRGVDIFYKHQINDVQFTDSDAEVSVLSLEERKTKVYKSKFILDASGFGRVLPRLLDLNIPSHFPNRTSYFSHFEGPLLESYDRNKILITVNTKNDAIWYWLIPFSDNTFSVGVVGEDKFFDELGLEKSIDILQYFIDDVPEMAEIFKTAKPIGECRKISGYSSNVKNLYGHRYALLGNAAEFLDPVFSSGLTIAIQSAVLAAPLVIRQIQGDEIVDWENEFSTPLKQGVDTFKAFVTSWYTADLQNIFFFPDGNPKIKKMICSILAGYAWDTTNPYTKNSSRRIEALSQVISS